MLRPSRFHHFTTPVIAFEPEYTEPEMVEEDDEEKTPVYAQKKVKKPKYLPAERLLQQMSKERKKDRQRRKKHQKNIPSLIDQEVISNSIENIIATLEL